MPRHIRLLFVFQTLFLLFIALDRTGVISAAMASSGVIEVRIVDQTIPYYRPLPVKVEGTINCE